jgi:glyoxylate/hydroxypyruvate reductase A
MSVQMAEFVCHAVIRHFRELDAYERDEAQGKWGVPQAAAARRLPGRRDGPGRAGAAGGAGAGGFRVPGARLEPQPEASGGVQCFSGERASKDFLAGTRILVCLLPLTDDTRGILNRATLSQLLPGGYVINVARGAHLVDEDLIALIDEGRLAGAALDVFRTEPLPSEHPFWAHPKITVTPHTSARTLREESIAQIAGKMRAFARGEPIAGVVDREKGY